jgi:hypothetical protein
MSGIIVTTPPLIQQPPGTAAANPVSLPPVTYTYALLNVAQTWGAKQTFPLGMIALNAADITGIIPVGDLPLPTASTIGAVFSKTPVSHQWLNSIGVDGNATSTQPSFADISGSITVSQLNSGTNASATTFWRGDGAWKSAVYGEVTLEDNTGGTGVSDNTAALNAAIASVGGPVRIKCGRGTYTFTTSPALIAKDDVIIEGSGDGVTILNFVPTADATFIEVNSGFTQNQGFQMRNLTLLSTNTTFNKKMLRLVDQSRATLENVTITGSGVNGLTGGANGSICIESLGRQFLRTKNVDCYGDKPIRLAKNPNTYLSTDHYHMEDMYLLGGTVYPLITVDPGVNISNLTLNGIALVRGTDGFYWNDTCAANHVQAINVAGSGYAPGEVITLAGGTFSSAITIRVVQIGGGGSIVLAAVLNPGIYTVLPTYPASQSSTTGVGTGATFTCSNVTSNALSIINCRSEQAANAASSSIYISPSSNINNVIVSNFYFDGGRKGIFLRRALHTTLSQTLYAPGGATLAVDADSTNECLDFQNCKWVTGSTNSIGLQIVFLTAGPAGETANALAPWAIFGSNPVTAVTYTTAQFNNAAIFPGSSSGTVILKATANPNGHTNSAYTTNNGTYVQPHQQTNPNSTQRDNYSATGNVNPHTGTIGTRNPRY